jgi:hypothetical protein
MYGFTHLALWLGGAAAGPSNQTVALTPAVLKLQAATPTWVKGGRIAALSAAVLRLLAPTQAWVIGARVAQLTPAQLRLLAPAQTVVLGGVIAALTPAAVRLVAVAVTWSHPAPSGNQVVALDAAVLKLVVPDSGFVMVGGVTPPGGDPIVPGGGRGGHWPSISYRRSEAFERAFDRKIDLDEKEAEVDRGVRTTEPTTTPSVRSVERGTEPAPVAPRPSSGVVKSGVRVGGLPKGESSSWLPAAGAGAGSATSPSVPSGLPPIAYAPPRAVAAPIESALEAAAPVEELFEETPADDEEAELLLIGHAVMEYYT